MIQLHHKFVKYSHHKLCSSSCPNFRPCALNAHALSNQQTVPQQQYTAQYSHSLSINVLPCGTAQHHAQLLHALKATFVETTI